MIHEATSLLRSRVCRFGNHFWLTFCNMFALRWFSLCLFDFWALFASRKICTWSEQTPLKGRGTKVSKAIILCQLIYSFHIGNNEISSRSRYFILLWMINICFIGNGSISSLSINWVQSWKQFHDKWTTPIDVIGLHLRQLQQMNQKMV